MSLSRTLQTRLTLAATAAVVVTAAVLTAMAWSGTQGLAGAAIVLVLLSALLSWLLLGQLLRPLGGLESELQNLQSERKQLVEERDDARVHLEEMEKTLARVGLEDALTGLANRRQFERGLLEEFNRAARTNLSLAVIMIDIDLFDEYNAAYGRMAGDKVLRRVGSAIRDTNVRPEDLLSRFGTQEIAVLLPGSKLEGALIVAERIRKSIEQLDITHSASPTGRVTISIGIASVTPQRQVDEPETVLRESEQALALAKASGRDCIRTTEDLVKAQA
ncbi:GGDEF domain-containing protein [Herbaspirillum sp. BH-1]|uniref:diguanylate cyclase n=2 Tax=Herbaspirillum frisingense TaxID=92645 RepID=A0AAI9IHV3_9BURK|nr:MULTISPECIES: diguanylate cyclase [Herbaspirillum]EOA06355.1 two-component response regulator with GGDEF domain [Herbaspirillum frisingense GSF30]MDR6584849.1 diguanylate cyclase (GGDEF)-like protein [Herbaspirillum frisingense]ONN65769.1 GGDEF domain-containing protein [Herbaspirillum sp. VT-16-41]PLY60706.1 GGDEF domain-containing protein [Herbaspirillum sp. BH-1]QNB05784.1 GGDEF domain-containing protein [Herbaspirillum frisingense]